MIKTVILDFGNVLGIFDKMKACERLADYSRYSGREIHGLLVGSPLEKMLESGAVTERAFCNEVLSAIGSTMTVADVMRVWGNIFSENPAMRAGVEHLIRSEVRLAVLSNTNAIHWPFISDLQVMRSLREAGACLVLSHEVGMLKPDRRMFDRCLEMTGSNPEETLFLDDLGENVAAFREIGGHSERYDCSEKPAEIAGILGRYSLL